MLVFHHGIIIIDQEIIQDENCFDSFIFPRTDFMNVYECFIQSWEAVHPKDDIVTQLITLAGRKKWNWSTVHILPHTNFTFFRTSSKDIDGCCSATRYAIELKIVLEQRAFIPYNISKAQPKRLRNKKVNLIFLLTFFLAVHGRTLGYF